MLLQFSVSNYKAFKGLQTLNMAASNYDKSLPENCIERVIPGVKPKKWVKGIALYGANASGKSTLLEAMKDLADWVKNSAKITDPNDRIIQVKPFALDREAKNEPTAFNIAFVSNNLRYEYRVAATQSRIWHESLRCFPEGKEFVWFRRDWIQSKEKYEFESSNLKDNNLLNDIKKRTLSNVLFISKAVAENVDYFSSAYDWFQKTLSFIDLGINGKLNSFLSSREIYNNTETGYRIVKLLKNADTGINNIIIDKSNSAQTYLNFKSNSLIDPYNTTLDVEVDENEEFINPVDFYFHYHLNPDRFLNRPTFLHKAASAKLIELGWHEQSSGTQRLYSLAGHIISKSFSGSVVFLDEIETSLHPILVRKLLNLIFSVKENPNGAQVIFTTHNPLLLDPTLIRRDQVWFTDKDDNGCAHLYPLTDYEPRKGESLIRGYLSGRYGAVPFIPEGLLGSFGKEPARDNSAEDADG